MKTTYQEIFNHRGDSYNAAIAYCPHARFKERQLLIDRLNIQPHHFFLDVPAGGGYLSDGISESKAIFCLEPSGIFSKTLNHQYALFNGAMETMPIASQSFDRVGSLAGLHHLAEKTAFIEEVYRILKEDGVFALADVQANTPQAFFLNHTVDQFSETGHQGMFLGATEMLDGMLSVGFRDVSQQFIHCSWRFSSRTELARYCYLLFGLVKSTPEQVLIEIEKHLEIREIEQGVELDWALTYAVGTR